LHAGFSPAQLAAYDLDLPISGQIHLCLCNAQSTNDHDARERCVTEDDSYLDRHCFKQTMITSDIALVVNHRSSPRRIIHPGPAAVPHSGS